MLVIAGLAIIGFIPAVYIKNWLPSDLILFHILVVTSNTLLYAILLRIGKNESFKEFLPSFAVLFLIIFYVSFILIRIINRYQPEWIIHFMQFGFWKQLIFSSRILLTIVLNGILIKKLGASRDLSGAYEKNDKAYWASQDGKYYMSANKMQSGEYSN